MADSIHKLQVRLQQLQIEVIHIAIRKSVSKERLTLVNKAFKMKYEELKEACSQSQRLQNYIEQFKNGQDYQELEAIVRSEVAKTLIDNKKPLQNALVSVIVALRNDPVRYLLIDRMELTPFTTTSIINYNSF